MLKELQKQAKALGLPYAGLSEEDLKRSIEEAATESSPENQGTEAPQTETENAEEVEPSSPEGQAVGSSEETESTSEQPAESPVESTLSTSLKPNVAIVLNKSGIEVRRYSQEVHGENFESLAKQFADSTGYSVKHTSDEPKIQCPSCHHRFIP